MPEPTSEIIIEMEPVSVPDSWIIQPSVPTPTEPAPEPYDYDYLFPPAVALDKIRPLTAPTAKELVINVETTDANPWDGRIVSISYLDLSEPIPEIYTLIDEDEEKLLNVFLDWFDSYDFTRLIGFKLTFDHRFIFAKSLLYRRKSEKWANVGLRDIKQTLDQVKEEFVYFPSKTGTLDDWGKHLLGYGKLGSQANFLKQYLAKNWEFVAEFSRRQILLTNDIYSLLRYSLGESSWYIAPETPVTGTTELYPAPEGSAIPLTQKTCPVCKAYNPGSATVCEICGAAI